MVTCKNLDRHNIKYYTYKFVQHNRKVNTSHMQFKIIEARTSKDPYHASNVAFILKHYKNLKPIQYTSTINNVRHRFLNAIKQHDEVLFNNLKNDSLEYLKKVIDDNNIHVKSNFKTSMVSQEDINHIKKEKGIDNDEQARKMYVSMRNAYMKKLTDANVDMQKKC